MKINQYFILIFLFQWVYIQGQGMNNDISVDEIIEQEITSDDENDRRSKMKAMMIWKLIEELGLSVDQAEKFLPRFREHRDEVDRLRDKNKELNKILNKKMKDKKKLERKEVKNILNESSSLRNKIAELEDKFIINTDDILDPSQQAKLGTFKNKMMRDVRGKMKKKVGRNDKKRKWGRRNKDNKRKYWNN